MLPLDLIAKLTAATSAEPVRVTATACLNTQHKDRRCTLCLACPTNAIQLHDTQVAFDETRCVECGLCAAVCPTRVFAPRENDAAILNAVVSYASLEFACARKTELGFTRAPEVSAVRQVNCLARLAPEVLIGLAVEHPTIWLNDTPCAQCPIGSAHTQIVAARDAANRVLVAWERSAVHCYSDAGGAAPLLGEPRRVPRAIGKTEQVSRREFFSMFSRNLGRAAGTVVASALGTRPTDEADTAISTRQFLARATAKLGAPKMARVPSERFATVQVSAACYACGLCAKICPTHALEFRVDTGYYVLAAQTRDCLGEACGLCKLFCSVKAITLTPGIAAESLHARDATHLRAGDLTVCGKCTQPFAVEPGEILCPPCRAERRNRAALMDEIRKIHLPREEV